MSKMFAKQPNKFQSTQEFKWYVLQCYSGFEESVIEAIKNQALKENIHDAFHEFYIPKIPQQGAKETKAKLYPGYIMINMLMNERTWSITSKTYRVIGFAGNKRSPVPLSETEYLNIVNNITETSLAKMSNINTWAVGDLIKIRDGSFQSFEGKIQSIDERRMQATVSIKIFDRETTIDLDWTKIEAVNTNKA